MARYLAQIVVLGAQVVGRAFTRAIRQEFAAAGQTTSRQRESRNGGLSESVMDAKHGMRLQEAKQILNIEDEKLTDIELINQKYNHLFDVNDKSKGGSFYIQSKSSINYWKSNILSMNCYTFGASMPLSSAANTCFAQIRSLQTESCNITEDLYENALTEENLKRCLYMTKPIKVVRPNFLSSDKTRIKAAVLVPFCHNELKEPCVLITLRSNNLVNHRGEVSFPGGIEEAHDNNEAVRTAVRETVEEIGIEESSIKVYGVLNPFPGSNNSSVYPVLGYIDLNGAQFNINEDEVESIFMIPLKNLCEEDNWKTTAWKQGWTTPAYIDKNRDIPRIWGITAGILHLVLSGLMRGQYNFYFNYRTAFKFDKK